MRIAIVIATLALGASACAGAPDDVDADDEIASTEQPLRKLCIQLMDDFNRALDAHDARALVNIDARSRGAGCGALL
jgi:hypothetical protein